MIVAMRSMEDREGRDHCDSADVAVVRRKRRSIGACLASPPARRSSSDADEHVTDRLIIGEGVESGDDRAADRPQADVGARQRPAPSQNFSVLDGVEKLMILAESDEANERATEACGDALVRRRPRGSHQSADSRQRPERRTASDVERSRVRRPTDAALLDWDVNTK